MQVVELVTTTPAPARPTARHRHWWPTTHRLSVNQQLPAGIVVFAPFLSSSSVPLGAILVMYKI